MPFPAERVVEFTNQSHARLAQLAEALDSKSEGSGFESQDGHGPPQDGVLRNPDFCN